MNVIDFKKLERDAGGQTLTLFSYPVLLRQIGCKSSRWKNIRDRTAPMKVPARKAQLLDFSSKDQEN
ncbi:hypothetical protein QN226_01970 [Sinorhizobium sp. 6-117]|nr:hypothetical protein [Sinorhizobium sp. 6-117]